MSSSSIPEGPGSVSGAPNLPAGFTGTFTSRYVDTGELRLHAVTGGGGPPPLFLPPQLNERLWHLAFNQPGQRRHPTPISRVLPGLGTWV